MPETTPETKRTGSQSAIALAAQNSVICPKCEQAVDMTDEENVFIDDKDKYNHNFCPEKRQEE